MRYDTVDSIDLIDEIDWLIGSEKKISNDRGTLFNANKTYRIDFEIYRADTKLTEHCKFGHVTAVQKRSRSRDQRWHILLLP